MVLLAALLIAAARAYFDEDEANKALERERARLRAELDTEMGAVAAGMSEAYETG